MPKCLAENSSSDCPALALVLLPILENAFTSSDHFLNHEPDFFGGCTFPTALAHFLSKAYFFCCFHFQLFGGQLALSSHRGHLRG